MPDVPVEIRSLFDDAELAAIAARPVRLTEERALDAIELAVAWDSRVRKIDADRELPWSDRAVWNEHDLVGSLFIRDYLQEALDGLPATAKDRLAGWVAQADELFRSYTVDDLPGRLGRVADIETAGRPWWWRRVPASGPIVEDLARYQRDGP